MTSTPIGRGLEPDAVRPALRPWTDCCAANCWQPLERATIQTGATLVIRGQRDGEARRNQTARDGATVAGIAYSLPIQDWSAEEVFAYLEAEGIETPRQYDHGLTSLDCLHCTALLFESGPKLRYLRQHHPAAADVFAGRLFAIGQAQQVEFGHLRAALDEGG